MVTPEPEQPDDSEFESTGGRGPGVRPFCRADSVGPPFGDLGKPGIVGVGVDYPGQFFGGRHLLGPYDLDHR